MKAICRYYTVLVFLALVVNVSATEIIISGQVTDASTGEPLPGVSVTVIGITTGTITNLEGLYTLVLSDTSSILRFTFVGYLPKEIKVGASDAEINIALETDVEGLDEVVVIGYGTSKKKVPTGAACVVKIRGLVSGVESAPLKKSEDYHTAEGYGGARAGILTAGEINDFSKWKLWHDISRKDLNEYKQVWDIEPLERYTLQLKNHEGFPLIDAQVILHIRDKFIWQGRTDNTGKAELWLNAFENEEAATKELAIHVNYKGQSHSVSRVRPFKKGLNTMELKAEFAVPNKVEIAFVVDATGSMGDEINYLKSELQDIAHKASSMLPDKNIRFGSVFYRDKGDEYLTRYKDFTSSAEQAEKFVSRQGAGGGGDFPEAVHSGLESMVNNLNWSDDALTRIAFLILDAPPHKDRNVVKSIEESVREAARKGIRLVPVTCSGIDKSTEYLMRSIALLTNGTYVFLTDDSGVGNPHIEPTTDSYEVEILNDLIIRLVDQYTKVPDTTEQNLTVFETEISDDELTDSISFELKATPALEEGNAEPQNESWTLFPNPCRGMLHVDSDNDLFEIHIYDYSGKLVMREVFYGMDYIHLNVSDLSNGNYVIKMKDEGDNWFSDKLIMVR